MPFVGRAGHACSKHWAGLVLAELQNVISWQGLRMLELQLVLSSKGKATPFGLCPNTAGNGFSCSTDNAHPAAQGGAGNGLGDCQGGFVVRGAARADLHEAGCPLAVPGHRLCQALQEKEATMAMSGGGKGA